MKKETKTVPKKVTQSEYSDKSFDDGAKFNLDADHLPSSSRYSRDFLGDTSQYSVSNRIEKSLTYVIKRKG